MCRPKSRSRVHDDAVQFTVTALGRTDLAS